MTIKPCKYVSLLLCGLLLISMLSACGAPASGEWESAAADLAGLGYDTVLYDKIDREDWMLSIQDGTILAAQVTDDACKLQSLSLEGQLLHEASLPLPDPRAELLSAQFTKDHVYAMFQMLDEEEEITYFLLGASEEGTDLWQKTMPQIFEEAGTDDKGLFGDFVALEDRLLFATAEYIYCLSIDGAFQAVSPGPGELLEFCPDGNGALFVKLGPGVYEFDLARNCVGEEAFSLSNGEQVLAGNAPYDFLLLSGTRLRGVELEKRRITELISWADCDLSTSVAEAVNLTEDQYLVSAYQNVREDTQLLLLSLLPEEMLPEKEIIQIAAAADPGGENWTNSFDSETLYAINAFNRASKEYRVEITTYSSAQELQLMMTTGDVPDLINFRFAMEDPPSPQLYAEKGYLSDLSQFLAEDPELKESDLLPNVLGAFRSEKQGLWALPDLFYVTTEYIPTAYAPESWDISGLYHLMQELPDEYCVASYPGPDRALEEFLEHCMDDFVNLEESACNFTQQSFYELLYLCRDYCGTGTSLTSGAMLDHGLGSYILEGNSFLREDITYVGYLGAKGNGCAINCPYLFAITASGENRDGAWQFLRTLFLPSYQDQSVALFPVRRDAFDEKLEFLKSVFAEDVDPAEFDAAKALIEGASYCETLRSPATSIVLEEAAAFFNGDKSAEAVAELIQSRVMIYLSEQS